MSIVNKALKGGLFVRPFFCCKTFVGGDLVSVLINNVVQGSLADAKKIESGDILISVNSHQILDFLDYRFYLKDKKLLLLIKKKNSVFKYVIIKKDEDQDIGLVFNDYMMDKQRNCKNRCIFCFIDQLPKGMRETLYFKDDDTRLSFLFGNYITLTNLTERDVERIIEMHISPVNISVHTTNPELRVRMMKNKHAGQALEIIKRLADAGIAINTQLVLCPGINDGEELRRTLSDLSELYPSVQMIAAVPLGVTKFREGLEQLQLYDKKSSAEVLDIIQSFAEDFYKKHGVHFAWAADEFYIKAERLFPKAEYYEDFQQLENGVGMCALMADEFINTVETLDVSNAENRTVTIATGTASFRLISGLCEKLCEKVSGLTVNVVPIVNEFFGETITVSGLVVGRDLIAQLSGRELGDEVLIPASMLKSDENIFLDDVTLEELQSKLKIVVTPVVNDGYALVDAILKR